jgi:hypothetical protein
MWQNLELPCEQGKQPIASRFSGYQHLEDEVSPIPMYS